MLSMILVLAGAVLVCGHPYHAFRRQTNATEPIIDLGYAAYKGARLEAGVDQFLGIRYAQAPLGDLRFRAPADPITEPTVQRALSFGPLCVGTGETADSSKAEDCLFVNVFKPSDATEDSKLPVWVYIQGGGYAANSNPNYNGTEVIQKSGNNLVFVNFNYRVGALGFLASKKVKADGALNAGLLDQRKLLHWVQTNIAKFGGDPRHVVIHGASAGAGSVVHHLTAYDGRDEGLFVGAVPQSPFWPTMRTVAEMEFQFDRFVNDTNCFDDSDPLTCLRVLDLATLQKASASQPFPGASSSSPLPLWYWLPVTEGPGSLVPQTFYDSFRSGKFIRVPLLLGDDTDEGSYFGANASSSSEVSAFLKNNYPGLKKAQLTRINNAYPLMGPVPNHNTYFPSASAAYGDSTFTCPGNTIVEAMSQYSDPREVWNYRYNVVAPENVAAGLGVPHTFENSAIFGPGFADDPSASYFTTNAEIVPVTMMYFISFVRALNPNVYKSEDAPLWENWGDFGSGRGFRLKLETNETAMEEVPELLAERCILWEDLSDTMAI